ncbi:MAG TPA: sialate O-acetylesterase [Pirellulaceae bacterium]|nr:sialate O-acetylesterase [Pirellulaceae bacterium]
MVKYHLLIVAVILSVQAPLACAEGPPKKMNVFILAGQSNMVGWGDSLKLPEDLRNGSDRVLMFEHGKWQPLKPFKNATRSQGKFGMTEFSFGPEIAFAHGMAKAWPGETIGVVKFSVGGTSILTWKPDWSKEDADRVGQGRLGSLYKKLLAKIDKAGKDREIKIMGFLWLQGGGDMKNVAVANEYLENLKSLVAAIRKDTGVPDLPFFCGSPRRTQDPDDISDLVPQRVTGPYPAVEFVLKAQWDAQKEIPNSRTVILRDIETHPMNVHYNTAGQLMVGKLFADIYLKTSLRIGGHTPQKILTMLGAKGRDAVTDRQVAMYRRIFGFMDANGDGHHSKKEFIDDGRYLTRQARQGIFRASDANGDGIVSEEEYIENRIITDEAKAIFETMDGDDNGKLTSKEFSASEKLNSEDLAKTVFAALDSDDDGELVVPEYLRVWGRWARSGGKSQPAVSK